MMAARKRFLASGCYDRISVTIGEIISSLAKDKREGGICVVDSGSGEGRHTCNIIKTVAENGIPAFAIVGGIGQGAEGLFDLCASSIQTTISGPMSLEQAMENAPALYEQAADRLFRTIRIGMSLRESQP